MRAPATRRPALASASLVGAATQVCAHSSWAPISEKRVRPQTSHTLSLPFSRAPPAVVGVSNHGELRQPYHPLSYSSITHTPHHSLHPPPRYHSDGPHALGRRRPCLPGTPPDAQSPLGDISRAPAHGILHFPLVVQRRDEAVPPKTKGQPMLLPPRLFRDVLRRPGIHHIRDHSCRAQAGEPRQPGCCYRRRSTTNISAFSQPSLPGRHCYDVPGP
jgi:hypothetical protein